MSTAKSAKVMAEIEKARAKMAEQQAHIKELETKHTEFENMEIVDIVRGMKIPLDGLAAALQSVKAGVLRAAVPTSGQVGPNPKKTSPQSENTEKEGEAE